MHMFFDVEKHHNQRRSHRFSVFGCKRGLFVVTQLSGSDLKEYEGLAMMLAKLRRCWQCFLFLKTSYRMRLEKVHTTLVSFGHIYVGKICQPRQ